MKVKKQKIPTGIFLSIFGLIIMNIPQFYIDLTSLYELFSNGDLYPITSKEIWLPITKIVGFLCLFGGAIYAIFTFLSGRPIEITFDAEEDYDTNLGGYLFKYKDFKKNSPTITTFDEKGREWVGGVKFMGKDILVGCGDTCKTSGKAIIK